MGFTSGGEAKLDAAVAAECVKAVLAAPWLEDEHETRLGVTPARLAMLLTGGSLDLQDGEVRGMVVGCINELLNGVHLEPGEWMTWFSVPKERVIELGARLGLGSRGDGQ